MAPGSAIRPGQVFDSNAAIIAASVEELGGEAVVLGIVPDDEAALSAMLERAPTCVRSGPVTPSATG